MRNLHARRSMLALAAVAGLAAGLVPQVAVAAGEVSAVNYWTGTARYGVELHPDHPTYDEAAWHNDLKADGWGGMIDIWRKNGWGSTGVGSQRHTAGQGVVLRYDFSLPEGETMWVNACSVDWSASGSALATYGCTTSATTTS